MKRTSSSWSRVKSKKSANSSVLTPFITTQLIFSLRNPKQKQPERCRRLSLVDTNIIPLPLWELYRAGDVPGILHVLEATEITASNVTKLAGACAVSQSIISSPPSVAVCKRCVQGRQDCFKAFPTGDGGEAVRPQRVEAHLASEKNPGWFAR